jgi:hypothetical protein
MLPISEVPVNSDSTEFNILQEFLKKSTINTQALRNDFEFLNDSSILLLKV